MARDAMGCHDESMDPYTAEPSLEDVAREFPRWHTWKGICGLLYASRRLTSPPAVMRAEDPQDLRDQIVGWEGKHSFWT